MAYGLLKNNLARSGLAIAAVQLAMLAQGGSALGQEREGARRGAPITYAGAAPNPQAAPLAALGESAAPTVTWRYPDEPDVVYSAAGVMGVSPAPQANPAAEPTVLDLRRTPGAEVYQSQPVSERPEWLAPERVGAPYQEAGAWYVPTPEPGFQEQGWLAINTQAAAGAPTASGEAYDPRALTAAHPTLPIPSLIQVTDLATGRDVIVRLNDRGPFGSDGLVALSPAAAQALGASQGARIHVRYLGPAPTRMAAMPAPAAAPAPAAPLRPETAIADLPLPPNVAHGAPVQTRPASYSPSPSAPRGAFVVQLGAFANLENAHAMRARVRTAGVVAIEPVMTAQGELFRVRLGPFGSEREAEAALAEAERLGARGGVVRALR